MIIYDYLEYNLIFTLFFWSLFFYLSNILIYLIKYLE